MLFLNAAFWFGFTQGFVVGPVTVFAISEGLDTKKGFWYQIQVILGATIVDIIYLLLAAYGAAEFIDHSVVKLVMWSGASYMLIHMGVNSFHERPHTMSYKHMHRHRIRFIDSDFIKAFGLNLVNPMAIVFWIMVAGSLYGQYKGLISPAAFAGNIVIGGVISSVIIAIATLMVRKIFHPWMLKKLNQVGSLVMIFYGIQFFGKAVNEAGPIIVSIMNL